MIKSLISFFLVFSSLCAFTQGITTSASRHLDSLFSGISKETPGCAIAVIQNGSVVYKSSFGQANLEYDIPITSNTVFNVGSIAKQFTALAILMLERDEKVSRDDDIRKYLPEIPDFGKVITLRHLIYHISGLREQFQLFKITGIGLDDVVSRDQIMKLFSLQKELNFDPGSQFMYCNTGYSFLAEIVSRVSGQSFPDFMKMNIFDPLNMDHTFFLEDHERIIADRAYSYFQESGSPLKQRRLNSASSGESNLYSNVEDLTIWLTNLSNPKPGWTEVIKKLGETTKLNNGVSLGYAQGMVLGKHKSLNLIAHNGEIWGYKSYICRFPQPELGIVVLSNLSSFDPEKKAMEIADIILQDQFPQLPIDTNHHAIQAVNITAEKLNEYCGLYWVKESEHVREIYLKNGQLIYKRGLDNESILGPIDKNRFRMLGVAPKVDVYFRKTESGLNMLVEVDDGNPIVSEKFNPIERSGKDLSKYAGTYFSEEIKTSYRIEVKNNTLVAHHLRNDDITLVPSQVPDQLDRFDADAWWFSIIKFDNKKGTIHGFILDTDRIKNLWFEKVDA